jgi:ABC-type multidrug transport system fused ATPase/permease subunit
LGIRARGALYLASYKKILRLASASSSVGEIINIQSSDGARIVEAFRFLYLVLFTPIVLVLDTWLIYKELGWAGVIGVVVLIGFFAFQTWVGGRIAKLREEIVAVTDERIRVMSDVLGAIKLVKLYVWEKPFSQKVRKIRSLETKTYRRRIVVDKLNHAVSVAAIALVYFLALSLAVVAFGTRLTVSSALTALALFNCLSYPLEVGSIGVKFVAEACTFTLVRLQRDLTPDEG